jgi:hypothetical protein
MEARALLQDTLQSNASSPVQDTLMYRYSDADMIAAFNGAMLETRAKRPDLFLRIGLRTPVTRYTTGDLEKPFPLDLNVYDAFIYYLVGRAELREDTFSNDGRAVAMMNKFVSQLMMVAS